MLDLVATGFEKNVQLFGHTMRTTDDVDAAADAFKDVHTKVAGLQAAASHVQCNMPARLQSSAVHMCQQLCEHHSDVKKCFACQAQMATTLLQGSLQPLE